VERPAPVDAGPLRHSLRGPRSQGLRGKAPSASLCSAPPPEGGGHGRFHSPPPSGVCDPHKACAPPTEQCPLCRGEMRRSVVVARATSGQRPAASLVVQGAVRVVVGVMKSHCMGSFASTLEHATTELAAGDWPLVAAVPPPSEQPTPNLERASTGHQHADPRPEGFGEDGVLPGKQGVFGGGRDPKGRRGPTPVTAPQSPPPSGGGGPKGRRGPASVTASSCPWDDTPPWLPQPSGLCLHHASPR